MERADPMLAMAPSTGVVANSSSNALAVGLWDAQQLEVMSSGSNDSPAAAGRGTKPAPMNPLLLASACAGSSDALDFLFQREDAQRPPAMMATKEFLGLLTPLNSKSRISWLREAFDYCLFRKGEASDDVEDGVDQFCFEATSPLLQGVTAEGDTALHVVASHGNTDNTTEFVKCARIINERDQGLLFAVNKKGDTPLHCAARAGKSQMLSCLIELAQSCDRLHELLRKENVLKETALHDAIRIGNNDIVESLMAADLELANYPKERTSPLYLAILLERNIIANTLYEKSHGNLSYHGPYGQNALHAAILRGTGTNTFISFHAYHFFYAL